MRMQDIYDTYWLSNEDFRPLVKWYFQFQCPNPQIKFWKITENRCSLHEIRTWIWHTEAAWCASVIVQ